MKEQTECAKKYPLLEQFSLTNGIIGGFICQIASFLESFQKMESSMKKGVIFQK